MASATSAAAAVALPSCCTSASSMATAFMSAPAAVAAALSVRMRTCPPSLPLGLALPPFGSGVTTPSRNGIDGLLFPASSSQWLSRRHERDVSGAHRSRPPTALYSIRRDLFCPALSKAKPTVPSWSSSSSSRGRGSGGSPNGDNRCFSQNRLAGAGDDLQPRLCRRRRRSTRLAGLRKPRDAGGPAGASENPDRNAEDGGEAGSSGGTKKVFASSVPASKRGPPEDDDIWSKHSVFEFKSLNDPDTNACGYKGLSGQPRAPPSSSSPSSSQGPAPELRLTSSQQPQASFDGIDELLEAERPAANGAPGIDADFFKFREKEALASVERRQEVERRRRTAGGRGGGGGGGRQGGASTDDRSPVKIELATQLGLPATSTYDELRTAYRAEIKRCHPDLAGDNEFRVKFLERKFLKLQGCWDEFSAGYAAGSTPATATAAAGARDGGRGAGGGSSQAARARARARSQEEARQQQAEAVAAAAAAQRSRRPVMDPGRKVMDPGNTSSC